MNKFTLTQKEKATLERRHKICKDGKERDRIKAVLLRSEGWSVEMISQALRIHEASVTRHLNDYGFGKLKPENGGSESALNEVQSAELRSHLENRSPLLRGHTHILFKLNLKKSKDYIWLDN